jgi:GT2 family glycosyltransferase
MSDESPTPLISVIIVNYNGRKFLSACLNSIFCQRYFPFEVIMVDNGSHDGSVEYVRENFPDVKIFTQSTNLGFAAGTNTGIRQAILSMNSQNRWFLIPLWGRVHPK